MPSVIQHLCDVCFAEDVSTVGEPHTWQYGTDPERVVILCAGHYDQLAKPLLSVLAEYGIRPVTRAQPTGPKRADLSARRDQFGSVPLPNDLTLDRALELLNDGYCLYEPNAHGRYPDRVRAAAHLKNIHGVTITQLGLGRRGMAIDRRNRYDNAPDEGEHVCDVCGKHLRTPQALGSHRNRSHGLTSTNPRTIARHPVTQGSNPRPRDEAQPVADQDGERCPDCGVVKPTKQALGNHRASVHGYRSPTSGADRKRLARQRAREARASVGVD